VIIWNEYERNTTQSTIMANDTINFITLKWTSFVKGRRKMIEGKDLAIEQTITDAKENNASSTINLCLTKEEVHVTPIMIDADNCAPSTSQWPTSWIPDLNITQADKDILTSSCAWLTDSIVNAAQMLIKRGNALVSGLQNVNLGLTNTFDVQAREFIQILHTGQGHWHVVSTIGTNRPEVNVFDSMYCHCSDHSKVQISSILRTQKKTIQLQYKMPSGEADCCLFTVTFATAL
jgi:hypothetical protein